VCTALKIVSQVGALSTLLAQVEREVADGEGVTVLNNQITCRIL